MSEFKFVQWGKGIPNDYQRLNAMMINDQYLKDKLDPSPRGVLAWKSTTSDTTGTVGAYIDFVGIGTVGFNVEENRMIKISIFAYALTNGNAPGAAAAASFDFKIDGVRVGTPAEAYTRMYLDSSNVAGNLLHAPLAVYFTETALSKGYHTVTPQFFTFPGNVTAKGSVRVLVEDIGAFVSEST